MIAAQHHQRAMVSEKDNVVDVDAIKYVLSTYNWGTRRQRDHVSYNEKDRVNGEDKTFVLQNGFDAVC